MSFPTDSGIIFNCNEYSKSNLTKSQKFVLDGHRHDRYHLTFETVIQIANCCIYSRIRISGSCSTCNRSSLTKQPMVTNLVKSISPVKTLNLPATAGNTLNNKTEIAIKLKMTLPSEYLSWIFKSSLRILRKFIFAKIRFRKKFQFVLWSENSRKQRKLQLFVKTRDLLLASWKGILIGTKQEVSC